MGTNQAEGVVNGILSPLEMDAIGEVMNISMGSAATAVSQMLDKQVEITTPVVEVQQMGSIKYEQFEPALLVKIVYTTGITGSNVMVFRQRDMQMILNTLMGIPDPPSDDFVFDELSISAACEVMNQMMGSSSTALAEFLNKKVDISTPTAQVMEDNAFVESLGIPTEEEVVSITFRLQIKDMVDSEFISVMTVSLVQEIISRFINKDGDVQTAHEAMGEELIETTAPPAAAPAPATAPAAAPVTAPAAAMPAAGQPAGQQQPAAEYAAPPPQGYAPYPPQMYQQPVPQGPPVDARPVEFPEFNNMGYQEGIPVMGNNLDLIMNVPLDVSIEIGTTKKKIKDIMNFTSGTVVELNKQAGAPVDIVVNGQLIAHGDVVVIDDNFGVRVTEIIGTKELINSLSEKQEG